MLKRIFSVLLCALMILTIFAACGKKDVEQKKTLKVAALSSGYEEAKPGMWKEICDAFSKKTGVDVLYTSVQENLYDEICKKLGKEKVFPLRLQEKLF